MKNRAFLLIAAAVVGCLLTPLPAAAFIGVPPQTLGSMSHLPEHIALFRVDKVSPDNGVIVFKHVEQLKGKYHGGGTKFVVPASVKGAKAIRDWAAEGKSAVMFYFWQGKGIGYVYIDGAWCQVGSTISQASMSNPPDVSWHANQVEPAFLAFYCGTADKLRDAVLKINKGEEVMVPAMAGASRQELEEGRAKVQEITASLKVLGDKVKPIVGDITKPGTKPAPDTAKPGEKNPALVGTIKALADDGKRFTLLPPMEKNKQPTPVEIQITKGTTINPGKLAVGQTVSVWLEKGDAKVATAIQIGKPGEKPIKPALPDKTTKPGADATPVAPRKPRAPAGPVRDPSPTAAIIDTEINKVLAKSGITPSAQADDAEFLRRVTLDLTGRIPTYQQTVAFLDSKDADKRRKLIDELLNSDEYGEHLGGIWKILLTGRTIVNGEKGGFNGDPLRPWLADQFNDNRGWNAIVADLLIAEGTPRDNPATSFLLANADNGRVQPNRVAGSVAALFWGVNLRCAECHKHPFANWKQDDFWGTAAFFGKLQYGGKGGPPTLAESVAAAAANKGDKGAPGAAAVRGTAIVIPATSGKSAGQAIKARFLGANEPTLDESAPFRPPFATWATGANNPFFAKATVNRMWAHFFGRGFVNPLDAFDTGAPSHPELLDRLASEFTASGFDLKHLARCITTSKAYQRSSRPVSGNEKDTVAFSHMAVKALTPEVLYDSFAILGRGSVNIGGKGGGGQESRDLFLRAFRTDEEATATDYIQGIPQLLRLMNASTLNRGATVIDNLCNSNASPKDAIDTLYLTVLSRRPSAEEVELMTGYLSRRKDDREGYRGVLWILLNTSEFTLNH